MSKETYKEMAKAIHHLMGDESGYSSTKIFAILLYAGRGHSEEWVMKRDALALRCLATLVARTHEWADGTLLSQEGGDCLAETGTFGMTQGFGVFDEAFSGRSACLASAVFKMVLDWYKGGGDAE